MRKSACSAVLCELYCPDLAIEMPEEGKENEVQQ